MNSYVVIGCGRFGSAVAKTLFGLGHQVLAIDSNMEIVQDIADHVTQAVQIDATDENALNSMGVRNYDVAIISISSDFQSSIMTTIILKEMGVNHIICKAKNELQAKALYKIGADRVVFPERDMGIKLAHNLVSTNVLEFIELDPNYSIIEIIAPKKWNNKTIQDLNFRAKYGITVVAVKRGEQVNISPDSEDTILSGDLLVVIGEVKKLNKLSEGSND